MDKDASLNTDQSLENAEPVSDFSIPVTKTWQRLSPIAIVYFGMSFIKHLFGQIIYIAPGVIISYNYIKDHPFIGIPLVLLVLGILIASALLSFYFFQYRLNKGSIEIRSGVFQKSHVNLPFERIQNVKLEQPFYYRMTGFACLQLDTAGSVKQEAKVVALRLQFAEQLKQEILSQHDVLVEQAIATETVDGEEVLNTVTSEPSANEQLLNTRKLSDLVIHGVTSNRIWIFLGVLAPFYDNMADYVDDAFVYLGIDLGEMFSLATHSWWEIGLYAFSMAMGVMLLLTLFSIFGSVLTFYGYTLTKLGDRYIRRSGLFTKHEVTMRLPRLQMIAQKQDWLDLVLKRINLKFEQTNPQYQQLGAINDKIIVPSITPQQSQDLINDVYPENKLSSIDIQPVSKRYIVRYVGYIYTPLFLLAFGVLFFAEKYQGIAVAAGIYALLCLITYLSWYRLGYAVDENFVYLRKGLVGVDYYVFPAYKVQQVSYKQSWFMKRHQHCTIEMILASGAVSVPFIKEEVGQALANHCLYHIESSGKSWM